MKSFLTYIPLVLVPVVDQGAKLSAPVALNNPGLMMGYMAHLPLFVKSVLLSSGFLLLFVLFVYSMLLLTHRVLYLRITASAFMGGVFSNCLDRMLFQYVRDHLSFNGSVYFNVADVFLWISTPALIVCLFVYRNDIWRENCLRRSFVLVSKSHQQITKHILAIFLATMLIYSLFQLAFLRFLNIGESAFTTYLWLSLLFGFCTFVLTGLFVFIYAQRIVGPLQALRRHLVDDALNVADFNIRKGDPLIELKEISSIIQNMEKEL